MRRRIRRKKYFIYLLLLLIAGVAIGYAAIQSTLSITGTSTINKQTWDVHFNRVVVSSGSATAAKAPTISNSTQVTYNVTLDTIGQYYEFTVDVVNGGSIAAKLSATPTLEGFTDAHDAYLNYTVTWSDGKAIEEGNIIAGGATKTAKVRIEYDPNADENIYPVSNQTLNLNFTLNFVQG